MSEGDKFYRKNAQVRALSIEYGRMMVRQQAIMKELKDNFPLPPGFTWGASMHTSDPIRAWVVSPTEEQP